MKLGLLLLSFTLFFTSIKAQNVENINSSLGWQDSARSYRTFISVSSADKEFIDKPVEFNINFTDLLLLVNDSNSFDPNSVRIIQVSEQLDLIDSSIVFQFDEDVDFNAATNAAGTFTFLLNGIFNINTTKYFHIYFDSGNKTYPPQNFSDLISYTDNVSHEGQSSFRIQTSNSIYFYHKNGAGFASLEDNDGNDWIGYSSSATKLSYRGIPNLGTWAHPGYINSSSVIKSSGPLKITIESTTNDNNWKLIWEIFPSYARMTLIKKGGNYWFLYEGVPGGSWDYSSDYIVKNNGQRTLVSSSWTTYELQNPEWVYLGDNSLERVLYLAKHQDDTHNDYFRPLDNNNNADNMSIFGFGRKDPYNPVTSLLLNEESTSFTIGFYEDSVYANVQQGIVSAINNPMVNLSPLPINLSVKLLLEGAYEGNGLMTTYLNQFGQIPESQPYSISPWNYLGTESSNSLQANIVDWVLLEISKTPNASSVFVRKAALIRDDGYLLNMDGSFPFTCEGIGDSDLYIHIKHRNHLGVVSSNIISKNANLYSVDFTLAGSAYGLNPLVLANDGNYLLISGDGNADGEINNFDNSIWRDENGTAGYLRSDFNLTGDVTAGDKNLHWRLNIGRSSQIP